MFHRLSMIVLAAFPCALCAQWPAYPTAGVPKTATGAPNLTAPAPRTFDGKPNLSGIWRNSQPVRLGAFGEGAPQRNPADPPTGLDQFRDIGIDFKDGLPLQPWAAELKKQRMASFSKDNPDAHCLPMGNMQFMTHPQPRKIVQTPDLIVILYEANDGIRQIFLDGRPLPNNDPDPWWYGYSIGKWDGDTLVVETTGFRPDGWLDINGSPLTEAAKITERFRRVDYGHLEITISVDDPKAYTKPWTVTVRQTIELDTQMIEFICAENEKDVRHMQGK
ncbi:MAG TPA: hypothetical protein VK708_01560 [Bryobacteraceae bacterium]|nr:hypothetical protein [Bryobacteraceae bacterium]